MKKYCYFILLIFFFSQNLLAQRFGSQMPPSNQPGKCYAKCLIPAEIIYEEYEETYPIYIGDHPDSFNFETIEVITAQGKTEWVKKRADRNCLSDNPNDCMVWCLVEEQASIEKIQVLLDTSLTKDFVYETFLIEEETTIDDAHTEWREVVCHSQVKSKLIKKLQEALQERGFYEGNSSLKSMMSSDLKAALTNFQKKNSLPVGQLDFETLEALDIDVSRF